MARRSRRNEKSSGSRRDLTEEDLADEIEPVSDEWAADYEYELDRRDTLASEAHPLADAEPELFRAFMSHFVWPRLSGRRSDLTIAERKGHDASWSTRTVAHRGHVRYRVERHLDPSRYWHRAVWRRPGRRPTLPYWLGLPHGPSTRNVTIDIDNHGVDLATFRRGFESIHPIWPGTQVCPPDPPTLPLPDLPVEFLEKARRLHRVLGSEAGWCISSRSLGLHVIMPLDRMTDSRSASDSARRSIRGAGLPATTEVYPWGGHCHRLPFGLDFHSIRPDGEPLGGFCEQMANYLEGAATPPWDLLLEGLLRHWRMMIEEASFHIVGRRTWRNLTGRIDATRKDIDRWRSGSLVAVPDPPSRPSVSPGDRSMTVAPIAD